MNAAISLYHQLTDRLDHASRGLGLLGLRLLLAWEFGEAGLEKWRGENWFADALDQFPFPFNVIPADINWWLATWAELGAAVALVLGLGTRFSSLSLLVLTAVAWSAKRPRGSESSVCGP